MELIDVYSHKGAAFTLYNILAEREPHQCISHKLMPDLVEHMDFFHSRPYLAWYLIMIGNTPVGAIYLSQQREIGIGVLKEFRGHGYGEAAIQILMARHPGDFYANIAPANGHSQALFQRMGFQHIQQTYKFI